MRFEVYEDIFNESENTVYAVSIYDGEEFVDYATGFTTEEEAKTSAMNQLNRYN